MKSLFLLRLNSVTSRECAFLIVRTITLFLVSVYSWHQDGFPRLEEATRASRSYRIFEEVDLRVNFTDNFGVETQQLLVEISRGTQDHLECVRTK